MRSPECICLLCQVDKATKTKSHIVPKFLIASLLSYQNVNQGFVMNTTTMHLTPQKIQNSPHEDYIFCKDCESYFSILETYVCNKVYNRIRDIRAQNDFEINSNGKYQFKKCLIVNSYIFRLLIYSIIWRCSITSAPLLKGLPISHNESESLRIILSEYKCLKQNDLIEKIENSTNVFPKYPFVLVTAEAFTSPSSNILYVSDKHVNPYFLLLNQYFLLFSFEENDIVGFDELKNGKQDNEIKIGFVTDAYWQNTVIKNFFNILMDNMIANFIKG